MSDATETCGRSSIGIIAGSGPEAGLDLWSKVLAHNQSMLGTGFRGDLDAPRVVILSEPLLGYSMELEQNEERVWESLRQSIAALSGQVDAFAIACNTLNWYAAKIAEMRPTAEFLSFQDVVLTWLRENDLKTVGLLGAGAVTQMGEWSAYRDLADHVAVETPDHVSELHTLIYDVKRLGSVDPTLRPRLRSLVESMKSDTILLACTELPLIADIETDKTLVDVTDLVAKALVQRSL